MPGVAELHDDNEDAVGRFARQLHELALGDLHHFRVLLDLVLELHLEALLAQRILPFAERVLEVVAGLIRAVVVPAGHGGRAVVGGQGRGAGDKKRQQRWYQSIHRDPCNGGCVVDGSLRDEFLASHSRWPDCGAQDACGGPRVSRLIWLNGCTWGSSTRTRRRASAHAGGRNRIAVDAWDWGLRLLTAIARLTRAAGRIVSTVAAILQRCLTTRSTGPRAAAMVAVWQGRSPWPS